MGMKHIDIFLSNTNKQMSNIFLMLNIMLFVQSNSGEIIKY